MITLRSFIDTIRQKISSLDYAADAYLNYANSVTGAEDTNVGDAIMSLAAGFGQGGGGLKIDFLAEIPATWDNQNLSGVATLDVTDRDFDLIIALLFPTSGEKIIEIQHYTPSGGKGWSGLIGDGGRSVAATYAIVFNSIVNGTTVSLNWGRVGWLTMPATIKFYTAKFSDFLFNQFE